MNSDSGRPTIRRGSRSGAARSPYDEVEEQIRHALAGLKYGHVTITVHEGQVQRIDRIEQVRLFRAAARPATHDEPPGG